MRKILFTILFIALIGQAYGQSRLSQRTYMNLADSLYKIQNYLSAANYYQRALKNADDEGRIMLQVAACYSKMNEANEAEDWFRKAKKSKAQFTNNDTYQFADILIIQQKRDEAEEILKELLELDPDATYARFVIEDLHNLDKYFLDSGEWSVAPISLNTEYGEFAPQYYKEGLVFTSSRPNTFLDKKYHWDGSHFLKLFYGKRLKGASFERPDLFDNHLNTPYHDGPITFYDNGKKIILNRNQQVIADHDENLMVWQLSLFEGEFVSEKEGWAITELPFVQPPYKFTHPSISADGNTLYFVSNMEGGYGGTDIYRIKRKGLSWGKPENLGPNINTHKNEAFPFCIDSTLYFASDGLGGLGGLDIFKAHCNGKEFSSPINLGYPINSSADDFSLITKDDKESGYFSTSRAGSDDIYTYTRKKLEIEMLVHVAYANDSASVDSATVELITFADIDKQFTTNQDGDLELKLAESTVFMAIANKGDYSGICSGTVDRQSGRTHMTHHIFMTYSQPKEVIVAGSITDVDGSVLEDIEFIAIDKESGDTLEVMYNQGVFGFQGVEGKKYSVSVKHPDFKPYSTSISIPKGQKLAKKLEIILEKEASDGIELLAHVFREEDQSPVDSATVELITFSDLDKKFTTNSEGLASIRLPEGTVFIMVGTKGAYSGMCFGTVDNQSGKAFMTHDIPLVFKEPPRKTVAGSITDSDGYVLDGVVITVTDEKTGDTLDVMMNEGLFGFQGVEGGNYNIVVSHPSSEPYSTTVRIPKGQKSVEKIEIKLKRSEDAGINLIAHVYNKEDSASVGEAKVELITFSDLDREFVTNAEGHIRLDLPLGTTFMMVGSKGEYSGMCFGTVDKESGKEFMTHLIPLVFNSPATKVVAGSITDGEGYVLDGVVITAIDEQSGDTLDVAFREGIFGFQGLPGGNYTVNVSHPGSEPFTTTVTIPQGQKSTEKMVIKLERTKVANINLLAHVFTQEDNKSVEGAKVELITFTNLDKEFITDADGNVGMSLPLGTVFMMVGSKGEYSGMCFGTVEKESGREYTTHQIPMVFNKPAKTTVAGSITDGEGYVLDGVVITAIDEQSGDTLDVTFKEGIFGFQGLPGGNYLVNVSHPGSEPFTTTVTIPQGQKSTEKMVIKLERTKVANINLLAHVFTQEDNKSVEGAKVELITFTNLDKEFLTDADGNVGMSLPLGTVFMMVGSKGEYSGMCFGTVEKESGREYTTHQIPMVFNKPAKTTVAGSITDGEGYVLDGVVITAIDEHSGDTLDVTFKEGIFGFQGLPGGNYIVNVSHPGSEPFTTTVTIPQGQKSTEKMVIKLERTKVANINLLAHVFTQEDNKSVEGAKVELITFTNLDKEFITDADGNVGMSLPLGTVFMMVGSKGEYSGMCFGTVEKESGREYTTHQIPMVFNKPAKTTVAGSITDGEGYVLDGVVITAIDEQSGDTLDVTFKDGIFGFQGLPGGNYTVSVSHPGSEPFTTTVTIPQGQKSTEKMVIKLEKTKVANINLLAHVFMQEDNKSVEGAKVELITFSKHDRVFVSNSEGFVNFKLPKGTVFLMVGSKGEYSGMCEGTVDIQSDISKTTHQIPMVFNNPPRKFVAGTVSDKEGYMLDGVVITFKEEETGKSTTVESDNGIFSFTGEAGKDYTVAVDHKDWQNQSVTVTTPKADEEDNKLLIALRPDQSKPDILTMNISEEESGNGQQNDRDRLEKASDGTTAGSNISNAAGNSPGGALATNANGMAPAGVTAAGGVTLVGNPEGHETPNTDGSENTTNTEANQQGENENNLENKDKADSGTIPVGVTYAGANLNSQSASENAENSGTNEVAAMKVIPLTEPLEPTSSLVVFSSEHSTVPTYFLLSDGKSYEIVEDNNKIYLRDAEKMQEISEGTLDILSKSPEQFLNALGISNPEIISLQNIYFDFNSTKLNDEGIAQLEKASKILQDHNQLQLLISAHADDRGRESYNKELSKKRANSVEDYLSGLGVTTKMIRSQAYGESNPVVPCQVQNCSEDDHSKNRRVELTLRLASDDAGDDELMAKNKPSVSNDTPSVSTKNSGKLSYAEILAKYGEKQEEGLVFKISIGAYRLNPNLTFDELKDLGTVEKKFVDGINFYFLESFHDLKTAENTRNEVRNRGIEDAFISIYYNDKIISFKKYLKLIMEESDLKAAEAHSDNMN